MKSCLVRDLALLNIYDLTHSSVAGAQVYENSTDLTSYSYNSVTRELVSYDTPAIVRQKVQYVNEHGLGGSMFWELSTDRVGAQSLVGVSAATLGQLDQTQNHIRYPNSPYDNIRSNMQGGGGTPSTTAGPTPTGGGGCGGVSAWSASAVYVGGDRASYGEYSAVPCQS